MGVFVLKQGDIVAYQGKNDVYASIVRRVNSNGTLDITVFSDNGALNRDGVDKALLKPTTEKKTNAK